MKLTSYAQWEAWSRSYTMLPFVLKFEGAGKLPVSWEPFWKPEQAHTFLLESGKQGQYTCVGEAPVSMIWGKGRLAQVLEGNEPLTFEASPIEAVKRWMGAYRSPFVDGAPKFIGGCVGYWSYDVVRSIEKIPTQAEDDLNIPDYYFMRYDQLWVIDQNQGDLYCCVHKAWDAEQHQEKSTSSEQLRRLYEEAEEAARKLKSIWDDRVDTADALNQGWRKQALASDPIETQQFMNVDQLEGLHTPFSKDQFIQAVERIQEYIRQGDVFQVNLSVRLSRALRTGPEDIYEWLRVINPSPYMGFLRFPEFQLVSASPELLVKLERGKVSTRPIAGTRRRGTTEAEDRVMAEELRTSEKERAEHVMLVDLERNDLGRISKFGSVKVDELMVIEYYSHVMHLVSEVVGVLSEGKDALDVIAATFPGGTITGAPKIRTMEIIEELEPTRRGPYTGSIGWIDYNGNMEFNIVIRTILAQSGLGHVQAGAGIVIDSIPEREYKESLNKAKALWKAIQLSERFATKAYKEGVQ